MALFKIITTSTDLPAVGAGREMGTFDFKGRGDPTAQLEMAKDIAAFANALGGVVLVGAHEDKKTGALGRYEPMDLATAEQLKKAYELAASQRCQPNPVVDVVRIEVGPPLSPTGNVIAVNVSPTPMGPVGVRQDTNGETFSFPLRTATHTHFLKPTELAMLMVPEIRRVAILLDSIPLGERGKLMLHGMHPGGGGGYSQFKLSSVDPQGTVAHFTGAHGNGSIPLDRVESVWKGGDDIWHVAFRGTIETRGTYFIFNPG